MNTIFKKLTAVFLTAALLLAGFSLPAGARSADAGQFVSFTAAPTQAEYASGERIQFVTTLSVAAFAEIYDADVSLTYARSNTYVTAGDIYDHYDRLDYGDVRTKDYSLFEDANTVRTAERFGSLIARIVRFMVHLLSQLSPTLRRLEYNGRWLRESFADGMKSLFAPRRSMELGSCRVIYNGEEIDCTFHLTYREVKTAAVPAVEKKTETADTYSLAATVTPDASALAGLVFGADLSGETPSGGFFFLDGMNQRVGIARLGGAQPEILAVKNTRLAAGAAYQVRLDCAQGRITAYLDSYDPNDAPYPVFDLQTDFAGGDAGVCGNAADLRVGDAPAGYTGATYSNPLPVEAADPYVLYDDGVYYLYATNSPTGFCASKSTDLLHWEPVGQVAHMDDIYGDGSFWAPEVYRHNGRYYLFYTTDMRLAVAVADSPVGPFVKTSDAPLFEERGIDGNVFFDDDGKIYLYMTHYDNFGGQLWGYEMNDDLISVKKETGVHIASSEGWEDTTVEGPAMIKHNGVYYLTYSGSQYGSCSYAIGYLTSDSPLGTFTRYAYNPTLQSTANIHGPGHHCFALSPDGSELFIVYHCHYSLTQALPRKLCIDRVKFVADPDGVDRLLVYGPTATPQPVPAGAAD